MRVEGNRDCIEQGVTVFLLSYQRQVTVKPLEGGRFWTGFWNCSRIHPNRSQVCVRGGLGQEHDNVGIPREAHYVEITGDAWWHGPGNRMVCLTCCKPFQKHKVWERSSRAWVWGVSLFIYIVIDFICDAEEFAIWSVGDWNLMT